MRGVSIGIIFGLFMVVFISALSLSLTSLVGVRDVSESEQIKMVQLQSVQDKSVLVNIVQSYPKIGAESYPAHYRIMADEFCVEDRAEPGVVSAMEACLGEGGSFEACEASAVGGQCVFAEELFKLAFGEDKVDVKVTCLGVDCVEIRVGPGTHNDFVDRITLYSSELGRVNLALYK